MNKQGTMPARQSAEKYAAARHNLQTFDIINTEHKDLLWRLIGHTAMIYRDIATGVIYVYESTTRNKFNGFSGVQLTPMRLWLQHYPGKVFVRQLYKETDKYRLLFASVGAASRWALIEIQRHIHKFRGVPYPDLSDPKQKQFVINSAIDLPFGIGQNVDRHDIFFCTQLVADAYQDCKLYTGEQPPSEWQPDDTRSGGDFEKQLAEGLVLGKEIRIK